MSVPEGKFDLWVDDDDVIGLTVAKTYPSGWPIIRTEPPFMDSFDEYEVGQFLAACLTNSAAIEASDDALAASVLRKLVAGWDTSVVFVNDMVSVDSTWVTLDPDEIAYLKALRESTEDA